MFRKYQLLELHRLGGNWPHKIKKREKSMFRLFKICYSKTFISVLQWNIRIIECETTKMPFPDMKWHHLRSSVNNAKLQCSPQCGRLILSSLFCVINLRESRINLSFSDQSWKYLPTVYSFQVRVNLSLFHTLFCANYTSPLIFIWHWQIPWLSYSKYIRQAGNGRRVGGVLT